MEPVAKRSRIGASPFDRPPPDDDELNSRPEEVNALRDPGIQLQKSRAFAAFKLKSAFENIFEKYGKDFEGIGDEIDLRTGEIIVDNGHIRSLKESTINRDDDNEENGEATEEEEEKERIIREKASDQFSLLGSDSLPFAFPPTSTVLQGPWSEPPPFVGVGPLLSSPMYLGQMQQRFGSYSTAISHGIPDSSPSLDPTWRAPELRPPMPADHYGPIAPPKRRRAKFVFITEEEEEGGEDDILLGASTSIADVAGAAASVLSEISPQVASSQPVDSGAELAAQPEPNVAQKVVRVRYKIPEILVKDTLKHEKKKRRRGPKVKITDAPQGSNTAAATKTHEPEAPREATAPSRATTSDKEAGSSTGMSFSGCKVAPKPPNQTLRVEIRAMTPADISTYMLISPEASPDPEASQSVQEGQGEEEPPHAMELDEMPSMPMAGDLIDDPMPDTTLSQDGPGAQSLPSGQAAGRTEREGSPKSPTSEVDNQPPAGQAEVFSRNVQDPSYDFSDEDEPTIPKRRLPRREAEGPKQVAIIIQSDALSGPTISNNPASSPTTTPSKGSTRPTDSFEVLSLATQNTEPQVGRRESCVEDEQAITEEASPHQTPVTVGRVTPVTRSFLSAKPRRSGIRRALANPDDTTVAQPILSSVERSPEIQSVMLGAPAMRKRKKRSSGINPEEEPAPPAGEDMSYDRVIPETPEPSPGPQSRRRPRDPSPDLGMSSPKGVPSPTNEDTAPQENPKQAIPNTQQLPPSPKPAHPLHPQTPSQKSLRRLSRPTGTSSAKNSSILSLISDDEDELSLDPSDFTPSGSRRPKPSDPKPTPATHKSLSRVRTYISSSVPSSAHSTKSTLTRRGAILGATASASTRTPPSKGRYSAGSVSRLSLSNVSKLAIRSGPSGGGPGSLMRTANSEAPRSPASRLGSELIQTPGGHIRRCGEGEFRCDRDFCFVCLS
ncbi:hypothetical protein QBC34DRAFT_392599 [Podospora aff. communis PSN243]|uniref:Centromere protein Scm3 n=1 Tax=Podospora aff. communis PSN243 TaxID=3040156 RepID=A0AAV9H295_9PEZI|nr:hypothetical protein QBC34DRAFT_392599 [Podospora aff. communis PSN243]